MWIFFAGVFFAVYFFGNVFFAVFDFFIRNGDVSFFYGVFFLSWGGVDANADDSFWDFLGVEDKYICLT